VRCKTSYHTKQTAKHVRNAITLCIENELNEEQIRIHVGNVTTHAHVWQNQFVTLQQHINLKKHEFVGQVSTMKMNINHEWHKLEHMRIVCNWCHLLLWCEEIIDGYT
jgi:hypothetical protein